MTIVARAERKRMRKKVFLKVGVISASFWG